MEGIINTYHKNKNIFNDTASYFSNLEGNIYINKESNTHFSVENNLNKKTSKVIIEDDRVSKDIKIIINDLGFNRISEEGNSIYFQKTAFFQYDSGLVYSKDGNKPSWPNLTVLEGIENTWYYYRSK